MAIKQIRSIDKYEKKVQNTLEKIIGKNIFNKKR
jgi:hypothetical protein